MENVVGHFVDHPVSAVTEAFQAFDVFVRQPMRQTRVGFFASALLQALYLRSDVADIAKLAGARDAGMAGGDLLDEAGSRSRHTNDKYRHFRLVAFFFYIRIKLGRAGFDQGWRSGGERCPVKTRLRPCNQFAVKGVRLGKAREGVVATIRIVEQPSQRKACLRPEIQRTIGVV